MKFDQKVKFKNVSVQETIGDECDTYVRYKNE